MVADKGLEQWEKADRLPVDEHSSTDPVFQTLLLACRNRNDVDIIYYGGEFSGGARTLSPLQIFKVKGYPHFYIEAYCHTGKVVRTFRVDRIELVTSKKTEDSYKAPISTSPANPSGTGCLVYVVGVIVVVVLALAVVTGIFSF